MHLIERQEESASLVSEYFKGREHLFSDSLNFDNMLIECNRLNALESVIPDSLSFHYDMASKQSDISLTDYYKSMLSGDGLLIENMFSGLSSTDLVLVEATLVKVQNIINEQDASAMVMPKEFQALRKHLNSLVAGNKAKSAEVATAAADNPLAGSGTDMLSTAKLAEPGSESKVGFLKQLSDSLTEGGTPFGILHLVLDFIGLVGDFIPSPVPIGVIADLINATIYFIRAAVTDKPEERNEFMLLGGISVIAGLIVGVGDILKGFKHVAKPMSSVLVSTMQSGKAGSLALSKVPAHQRGLTMKGLRFLAANIGGALSKAINLLSRFFSQFIAKVVGWIPFVGKPLKKVFEKIAKTLSKTSDNFAKFTKNYKGVEGAALTAGVKNANGAIDKVVKNGGHLKLSKNGKTIQAISKKGKVIDEFPHEYLTDPKIWKSKAPGLHRIAKPEDIIAYANFAGKPTRSLTKRVGSFFIKRGIQSTARMATFVSFIGKQLIKMMYGNDFQKSGFSEAEAEAFGSVALNTWIDDKLHKKRVESEQPYVPSINLDSSEEEVFINIAKYQNNYAKLTGQPSIIHVLVDKHGNDKVEKEFEDLWSAMAAGDVKYDDKGEKMVKVEKADESLKYVKSRASFLL